MTLFAHLAVLGLVVLDLVVGAPVAGRFGGRWAAVGFEFAIVLGYIVLVLPSWRRGGSSK
jgi:hypothetical protein